MTNLICLACCLLAGFQEESATKANVAPALVALASEAPTAQEKLLAELLAELPDDRRSERIARALANSRLEARQVPCTDSPSALPLPTATVIDSAGKQSLDRLRVQQQLLELELREVRAASQLLQDRLDSLSRSTPRERSNSVPGYSQTFVLPKFQRPGLPMLHGPYVNQPSGPVIAIQPPFQPETEQAISNELAQLSRDLFRLNQRLRKLQGNSEVSRAPMVLNQPSKEASEQAKRPSPLLPR